MDRCNGALEYAKCAGQDQLAPASAQCSQVRRILRIHILNLVESTLRKHAFSIEIFFTSKN